MRKHAYMIIAHNQFDLLEKTIHILDDERNDFYIHIDAKVSDFDYDRFRSLTKYSSVKFVPSVNVAWGGYSLIQSEINLISAAIKENYSYYHLISGVDMPIKTADEIYTFFESNSGKEFIHIGTDEFVASDNVQHRARIYHFFQDKLGKQKNLLYLIEKVLIKLQKLFRVDRLKNCDIELSAGSQWFSITHKTAAYILSEEETIKKMFSYGFCVDEVFLQTFFMQSPYKDNLFDASGLDCPAFMRHIDWKRGDPYTFRSEDFDELINSDAMFARKFDLTTDSKICDMLYEKLRKKE